MNFRYRLMQFMSGRYGIDTVFYVLFVAAAVISFINCFVRSYILQIIVYLIVVFALLRVLSRNREARLRENRAVRNFLDIFKKRIDTAQSRRADFDHVYKKCPCCHAVLRLPRRKGRHTTVCPKCGNSFKVRVFKDNMSIK